MVPASNLPNDPLGDPSLWNHTWVYWQDPPESNQVHLIQGLKVNYRVSNYLELVLQFRTQAGKLQYELK